MQRRQFLKATAASAAVAITPFIPASSPAAADRKLIADEVEPPKRSWHDPKGEPTSYLWSLAEIPYQRRENDRFLGYVLCRRIVYPGDTTLANQPLVYLGPAFYWDYRTSGHYWRCLFTTQQHFWCKRHVVDLCAKEGIIDPNYIVYDCECGLDDEDAVCGRHGADRIVVVDDDPVFLCGNAFVRGGRLYHTKPEEQVRRETKFWWSFS